MVAKSKSHSAATANEEGWACNLLMGIVAFPELFDVGLERRENINYQHIFQNPGPPGPEPRVLVVA